MKMGIGLKKILFGTTLAMLSLAFISCGLRDDPGPASDEVEEVSAERDSLEQGEKETEGAESETGGITAVADFHYMQHPYPLSTSSVNEYVINGEWLYYLEREWIIKDGNELTPPYVSRSRISDGYHDLKYIMSEKDSDTSLVRFLLADGAGNCYLFWEPGYQAAEGEAVYELEKYGTEGELVWRASYAPEELSGMGSSLTGGLVTKDGRVFLFGNEMQGSKVKKVVFSFDEDGAFQEMFVPDIEVLDGIVEGKDGKVYCYGITEKNAFFLELGGDGKACACPVLPVAAYSGHEKGICLHTEEGVWGYEPETGETELLWRWDDEYVQMNGHYVDSFFSGDGKYMLLYLDGQGKSFEGNIHTRGSATFVSLTLEDSKNYARKQEITLSTIWPDETLDQIVRLYNRHSKEYRIVVVEEKDSDALMAKLLRGEASDLINMKHFYAGNLAEQGAFEELTSYYEASSLADKEEVLDSVKRACTIRGKDVAVIPSFSIQVMRGREAYCSMEEWDVWKFLEMGQENRMFSEQSPEVFFQYCMGIRYGERFVDWEKGESHFDSEEFRRLLEECAKCKTYKKGPGAESEKEGDWLITSAGISSIWHMVSDEDAEYSAKLLGYPGWDGGESKLLEDCMFAINSKSGNKEGAWSFLEYLLSEEFQDMVDWGLPVRKGSFEARLQERYVSPDRLEMSFFLGEPAMPTEVETALLKKMAESALCDSFGGQDNPIWSILANEAAMYFSGDAGLDETVAKIQNRMRLYLDEN